MNWQQIRDEHPDKWVVFEALEDHIEDGKWCVDLMQPVGAFDSWGEAWKRYRLLKGADEKRKYGFYHTANEKMDITMLDQFRRKKPFAIG